MQTSTRRVSFGSGDELSARRTDPRRSCRLSILTLNVYAGPPLPTMLAGSLEGSERLRLQIKEILHLKPDLVCCQEVLADGVRSTIIRATADYYGCSSATHPAFSRYALRAFGSALLIVMYGLLLVAAAQLAAYYIDPLALPRSSAEPAAFASFIMAFGACAARVVLWVKRSTLYGFAFGETHPAGLLLLHKRSTLRPCWETIASQYTEQAGDLMNLVRPRGVLWRLFELKCDGSPLWVGNTHADALSAGGDALSAAAQPSRHRCAQLSQLFSEGERLVECFASCGGRAYDRARVLVAGDLNTTRELREVDVMEKHGFEDAWVLGNGDVPCHSWDGVRNPLVTCGFQSSGAEALRCTYDYILRHVSSGLEVTRASLALDSPPWLSDHFGVLAEFAVKPLHSVSRDPLHRHPRAGPCGLKVLPLSLARDGDLAPLAARRNLLGGSDTDVIDLLDDGSSDSSEYTSSSC
mmetsp:Transcript_24329/g.79247  ORF Transcript_24329/g.79247 Transcript_24329/m.79247 type:complete len:467 (-) Transcript_24329:217-1617(-)